MEKKNGIWALIIKIAIQVLNFVLSFISPKDANGGDGNENTVIIYHPDEQENKEMKEKVEDKIRERIVTEGKPTKKGCLCGLIAATLFMFLSGCFSFNFNTPDSNESKGVKYETILLANTNNVYRLATNAILRVKIQKQKGGKWVECEHRVQIPENWFLVSGDGIDK